MQPHVRRLELRFRLINCCKNDYFFYFGVSVRFHNPCQYVSTTVEIWTAPRNVFVQQKVCVGCSEVWGGKLEQHVHQSQVDQKKLISYNFKKMQQLHAWVAGWPKKLISYNKIIVLRLSLDVAGWPEKLISYNTSYVNLYSAKN